MAGLIAVSQSALALVFMAAATGKTVDRPRFTGTLRLSGLPPRLAQILSVGVPTLEVALAGFLILARGQALIFAFGACAVVLFAFTVWLATMIRRKINVRCGCFGRRSEPIGPGLVFRNLGLMVLAVVGGLMALMANTALANTSLPFAIVATSIAASTALIVYVRAVSDLLVLTKLSESKIRGSQ